MLLFEAKALSYTYPIFNFIGFPLIRSDCKSVLRQQPSYECSTKKEYNEKIAPSS